MSKLLICDSEESFVSKFKQQAERLGCVVEQCESLQEVAERLVAQTFDAVIFDMVLPNGDGLELLSHCKAISDCRFISITWFINDYVLTASKGLGVDYILSKDMDSELIFRRIAEIISGSLDYLQPIVTPVEEDSLTNEVSRLLSSIGMQHGRLGFKYAKDTLLLMLGCNNNSPICRLYDEIAQQYSTRSYCVERSIRSAIEDAWTNGSVRTIDALFGYTTKADKGKPTNREFLTALYERLKLRI